jgi:aldehyde dehydrogenase (NAD+)
VKEGAKLLTGGKAMNRTGYFMEPTVFADCDNQMKICREEIFGPVMTIQKFSTNQEAIQIANDTEFGLAAGLATTNLDDFQEISSQLRAGNVFINGYNTTQENTPFGGFKASGIGRELGEDCVNDYTETRTIIMKKPDALS